MGALYITQTGCCWHGLQCVSCNFVWPFWTHSRYTCSTYLTIAYIYIFCLGNTM